jgi:hypothetical protein
MIKFLAVIRSGHVGKVLSVDGCDVRRVWAEETAQGTRVIGEYSDKNVARRHMLLALERFHPSLERKKA